ncbi:MAG: TlyA family RNA methyltransferase [Proteobacteria bacterium]|nr:TlyA family RNA methyltransferase [Pseudomonadota bacterium]
MPSPSARADVFLVEHGYAQTRAEAQEAIEAGKVFFSGRRVIKPSQTLNETGRIQYERAHPYVSRGALKLAGALNRFKLEPHGLVCLDIGASTGGFTELLILRGAVRIYAVDVGHGQMNPKLIEDPRVVLLEGVNARDLAAKQIPQKPQAIVADVSFISLKLALPAALEMAEKGAWLIALVKPQFEAGRENVGKGGIVKDEAAQQSALAEISRWLSEDRKWSVLGTMESTIKGGDGNREFLIAACKP